MRIKRKIVLGTKMAILLCLGNILKAQPFVNIPDANFVNFLTQNYPSCMTGNSLNITCSSVLATTSLNVSFQNISNLSGVEYFSNLQLLNGVFNPLSSIPQLPPNLIELEVNNCLLSSLPALPSSLEKLICNNNPLIGLPNLAPNLKVLNCSFSSVTNIPALPSLLEVLRCENSNLSQLPALPISLQFLSCGGNSITALPALPNTLLELYCNNNLLTVLPTPLPNSLNILFCQYNNLTVLPPLPNSLINIDCSNNSITALTPLPSNLLVLYCPNNQLQSIPALPNLLTTLQCSNNILSSLPVLPTGLKNLGCGSNSIIALPNLPPLLENLGCENNLLTSLPGYPSINLTCGGNNISCFQPFPLSIGSLNLLPNPINCIPNLHPVMNTTLASYPLCTIGNSNNCPSATGISGHLYKDLNSDCAYNNSDSKIKNLQVKLFDLNNNFISSYQASESNAYHFISPTGNYRVEVDTANIRIQPQCIYPGIDSNVVLSGSLTLAQNVDFNFDCKPGFDLSAGFSNVAGSVFPGTSHILRVYAGDNSINSSLKCSAGISGKVIVNIVGPVSINGPAPGAFNPVIAGNSFTYNVSDFTVLNSSSFRVSLSTFTSATIGNSICVSVSITPFAGDYNQANNTYSFCYAVGNSYDPNEKITSPVNIPLGSTEWIDYVIHFQNLGNASARNIRVLDTLDNNIEIKTLQVINYSHQYNLTLNNSLANFYFPEIMLPDSLSDPEGSKGFVHYRVRPKANLIEGTKLKNRAHIYFDYNSAVITNQTVNTIVNAVGVNEFDSREAVSIYPNPAKNEVRFIFNSIGNRTIIFTDLVGREVLRSNLTSDSEVVQLSSLSSGLYIVKIEHQGARKAIRLILD